MIGLAALRADLDGLSIIEQRDFLYEMVVQSMPDEERSHQWRTLFPQLTPAKCRVLDCLWRASPREATYDKLFLAAAGGHRAEADLPDEKIVQVYLCAIRKAIRPTNITISNIWGRGYRLNRNGFVPPWEADPATLSSDASR